MRAGFRGKEVQHVGNLHAKVMDCAVHVLILAAALLRLGRADSEAARAAG